MSNAIITDLCDLKDKKRAWRLKRPDPVIILEANLEGHRLVAEVEFQEGAIYGELSDEEQALAEEIDVWRIGNVMSPAQISKVRDSGYLFFLLKGRSGYAVMVTFDPENQSVAKQGLDLKEYLQLKFGGVRK